MKTYCEVYYISVDIGVVWPTTVIQYQKLTNCQLKNNVLSLRSTCAQYCQYFCHNNHLKQLTLQVYFLPRNRKSSLFSVKQWPKQRETIYQKIKLFLFILKTNKPIIAC